MRYEAIDRRMMDDVQSCPHCGAIVGQGSWYEQCACTEELGNLMDDILNMTSEEYQED